ncbi:MAG: DegT/DnrJ/EryC1/StrS family aminotransferase [Dongiaceae bacterium]
MGFKPRFSKSPPPVETATPAPAISGSDPLAGLGRYSHGRTALQYGLAAGGLRAGDRVLVPDFVCDAMVLPLQQLQLVPVYFPVESDLQPRWSALDSLASDDTRALVMIHYFGIPQAVDRYRDFCRGRNLILIEDNAHGFGGRFEGEMLGTLGDIAISSPWKNFAIRNGGLLYVAGASDRAFESLSQQPRRFFPSRRKILGLVEAGWRKHCRYYGHGLQTIPPTAPLPAWRMSEESVAFLRGQDFAAGATRRRDIYETWQRWALRSGLEPVIERLAGAEAPLLFPAYCRDPDYRHALLEWAWRRRIEASTWPKLPPEVLAGAGAAQAYWARMICLPIHQDMPAADLVNYLDLCGPVP